jgi:sortase A
MTSTTESRIFPLTRTQCLLCHGRWLFFGIGILAIVYSGFTLLDAWLYQASAMRSLDRQIHTQQEQPVSPVQPVKEGDVLARLTIPRLGMSVAVLQGATSRVLRLGAGHIEGTPLPWELGNSGIAGHRDTFFRGLKGVRQNDEIQLLTTSGLLHYEVDWMKVVAPDDLTVLAPSTESALTLVTCYPFYFVGAAPERFVVHAQRRYSF